MEERVADKPLRFVVLDDTGRRSGLWYIKTAKNSDDVFLWEATTAGQFKISLHNEPTVDPRTSSQPWRLAMTREYAEAQAMPREILWEGRGATFIDNSVLAPGLIVPRAYLQEVSHEPDAKYVRYTLKTSTNSNAVVFRMLLAKDDASLNSALARYQPFARLQRFGDGWVGIGTVENTMSTSALEVCDSFVETAQKSAKEQSLPMTGRVVGVLKPDETEIPVLVDLWSN